nr:unnamed protein product [Callosobruchus chinensis]
MDSLHVSSPSATTAAGANVMGPTGNSKTSSRSASPCRPRLAEAQLQQQQQTPAATTYHGPHHVKTLSHGSVDSAKSQDAGQRQAKHRSPTTSLNRTTDLDDSNQVNKYFFADLFFFWYSILKH